MGCEICGRGNCCKSFHSADEQNSFDDMADNVKDRMARILSERIGGLDGHFHGDNFYIRLDDAIKEVEEYY